jgi:flavin-binding protein dodecin
MARVIKIVELMGVSEESFDDAVRQAVKEASKTIRNITGVEVIKNTADVDGDEIFEYHVTVRLAFVIDRDQGAAGEEDEDAESEEEPESEGEGDDVGRRGDDDEDAESEEEPESESEGDDVGRRGDDDEER